MINNMRREKNLVVTTLAAVKRREREGTRVSVEKKKMLREKTRQCNIKHLFGFLYTHNTHTHTLFNDVIHSLVDQ